MCVSGLVAGVSPYLLVTIAIDEPNLIEMGGDTRWQAEPIAEIDLWVICGGHRHSAKKSEQREPSKHHVSRVSVLLSIAYDYATPKSVLIVNERINKMWRENDHRL